MGGVLELDGGLICFGAAPRARFGDGVVLVAASMP